MVDISLNVCQGQTLEVEASDVKEAYWTVKEQIEEGQEIIQIRDEQSNLYYSYRDSIIDNLKFFDRGE